MKQQYQHPQTISIHVCVSELLAPSLDGAEVSGNGDVPSADIPVGEDNESGEGLN